MTFFEQLKSHVGSIIRLKSDLYWYNIRAYDDIEGRVCLLLDVTSSRAVAVSNGEAPRAETQFYHPTDTLGSRTRYAALLLINDLPVWVWVTESTVEFIS
jgi:hypothetical protein